MKYQIKQANELTEKEIEHILQLWEVSEWNTMKPDYFRSLFKDSEFHFLLGTTEEILAIIRVNFDFTLKIEREEYTFAEVVGFVATHRKKGYGSELIQHFMENVRKRNMETIGFCHSELRSFYEKCEIEILYDKAELIKENTGSEWINSDDDDILIFKVSDEKKKLLNQLSTENNAYLITKE
ncbi:GNAT family N-acetyltransferase [Chryseobacterium joostei]|uniref:Acetyltransferase (GNAT) domain-containing protein n=1 Tax=Chryseobacterium joostei TaxID=112234 RepID=A0A1N7IE56_9FLAO|nr:GNAT family N-acetyltransferase [Chryseobacterium joostei]AZB02114.1 GNAT family N-acetyltransferase [Chryseobacterium joostei]SIS35348.1 Acetyltransferase (GNAT) domain-containing protein [Chryseobacterium joostei]